LGERRTDNDGVKEMNNPAADEPKAEQTIPSEPATVRQGRRLNLDKISLAPPAGRKLNLTNEEIYELIEFP
jgi:hypothetical protein